MTTVLRGRAWVLPGGLEAGDVLAPAARDGSATLDAGGGHLVLHEVFPDFAERARRGDLLFGAPGFGRGRHTRHAITLLRDLGIAAVVADRFAAEWERSSWELGLPALMVPGLYPVVSTGDEVTLRPRDGVLIDHTTGGRHHSALIAAELLTWHETGGIRRRVLGRVRTTNGGS